MKLVGVASERLPDREDARGLAFFSFSGRASPSFSLRVSRVVLYRIDSSGGGFFSTLDFLTPAASTLVCPSSLSSFPSSSKAFPEVSGRRGEGGEEERKAVVVVVFPAVLLRRREAKKSTGRPGGGEEEEERGGGGVEEEAEEAEEGEEVDVERGGGIG